MKPLSKTNPYLKDKEKAEYFNNRSTRTSCGVEGMRKKDFDLKIEIDHSRSRAVYKRIQERLKNQ